MLWSKAIGAGGASGVGIGFVGSQTSWTVSAPTYNYALNAGMTDLLGGIASSPSAGDLILVLLTAADTAPDYGSGIIQTAGYTTIIDRYRADGYRDTFLTVGYKISDGTEVSVTCSRFDNHSRGQTAQVRVYRGINAETPVAETYSLTNGVTSIIDPPAITKTTNKQLLVAGGAVAYDHTTQPLLVYTSPDLTNFSYVNAPAIVGCDAAWGHSRVLSDPAPFQTDVNPSTGFSVVSASLLLNPV